MRILVLGKSGMLGHVVYHYFKENGYEVFATTQNDEEIQWDAYLNLEKIEDIIKEKGTIKLKTKGDNNEISDPDLVDSGQVYGKVLFKVKRIGKVISYIQNVRGLINIAIFVVIVYILISLRDKQKNTRKMKRKKYEIKKMRDNYHL